MNILKRLTYPVWKNTFKEINRSWNLSGNTSFGELFNLQGEDIVANETTAQKLSAVYTCLKIYSESYAQLPKHVLQKGSNNKRINDKSNSIYKIINVSPNDHMTSYDFWYTIIFYKYAWGNGLAEITRFRGEAVKMDLLEPWECKPHMSEDNEIFIIYKGRAIPYRDIFHLKNHSKNGFWGTSTLSENKETIKSGLKQEQYGQNAIGEKPPAILGTDQSLTADQYTLAKKLWKDQEKDGIGKTKILGGGFKFNPTMIPPSDAQYLESKAFTSRQIYSIFRLPPTFAQDYERATFSNAEQQDLVFVKHSLMPGIVQAEQEINFKLFAPSNSTSNRNPFYAKINTKHFLRGDTNAQRELLDSMISKGVFSPNMALEFLDMDPYEGGDRRYIQAGFIPIDKVDQFLDSKKKNKDIKINGGDILDKIISNGQHKV